MRSVLAIVFLAACGGTSVVDSSDASDAAPVDASKDSSNDCAPSMGCVIGAAGKACSDGVIRPISCANGKVKCMSGWIPKEDCGCGPWLPDGGLRDPGDPCN